MQLTAKELARVVNGTIEGDENVKVWKPCKIEEGCEGGITFLGNPKYTHYIYEQQASIVIVRKDFVPEHPVNSTLIRVDNPYIAVALLLHTFNERTKPPKGRSWRSHVGRGSKIGKHCYMGPYAVVGRHTMIVGADAEDAAAVAERLVDDAPGVVRGPVVNDYQLPVPEGLVEHALDGPLDVCFHVIARNYYCDCEHKFSFNSS